MGKAEFDLRDFRENVLHLTQLELANMLGLRQDNVSRMEKNPEQTPYYILRSLANISGRTIDQVVGYKSPAPNALEVDRTWTAGYSTSMIQRNLADFCEKNGELLPENQELLDGLKRTIQKSIRKPSILIAGGFSSGKKTLLNNLLGENVVPTRATTRPVPILVRHLEDKPAFLYENTYLIQKPDKVEAWDDSLLEDEQRFRKIILAEGNGVLESDDSPDDAADDTPRFVLSFVKSDILKNCDVVCLPAPETDTSGKRISAELIGFQTDILLYLLPSSSLRNLDAMYFNTLFKTLRVVERADHPERGKLSNLYLVVSKARQFVSQEEASEAAQFFCKQLFGSVPELTWAERQSISGVTYVLDDIVSRAFFYDAFSGPEWRSQFEKDLRNTVESMPEYFNKDISYSIKSYCDMAYRKLTLDLDRIQNIKETRESYREAVSRLERSEADRWARAARQKDRIISLIDKCRTGSLDRFQKIYAQILSEQNLMGQFKSSERVNAEKLRSICLKVNSELELALQDLLKGASEPISREMATYLDCFQDVIQDSSFSAQRAFAEGLRENPDIGGLTRWLAEQDSMTVAVEADLLKLANVAAHAYTTEENKFKTVSGTGFAVSSMAALTIVPFGAVVAALGGVWFALTALGSTSAKKMSAKVVKLYEEEKILDKCDESIEQFWENTLNAFLNASDSLEKAWNKNLYNLNLEIQKDDEELARREAEVREIRSIMEHLFFSFES